MPSTTCAAGTFSQAEPNGAHRALARLEAGLAERGGRLFLCTQNIDDLHERAGSRQVVHMHGELLKARCTALRGRYALARRPGRRASLPVLRTRRRPAAARGLVRRDAAGDGAIYEALLRADLFVAIGTSGSVYPAAGFVTDARAHGIRTCEINLEPSDNAWQFDEARYGPAGEVVPRWVDSRACKPFPSTSMTCSRAMPEVLRHRGR